MSQDPTKKHFGDVVSWIKIIIIDLYGLNKYLRFFNINNVFFIELQR